MALHNREMRLTCGGANGGVVDVDNIHLAFVLQPVFVEADDDILAAVKRVSDSLGTATEMRAMQNYAGHRLAPWLSHLMVSRSETARPLLTPGEVMQLPANDEIVMVAGIAPIRTKKPPTTRTIA